MMKVLRMLRPEPAHSLALWALRHGFGPAVSEDRDLSLTLFGRHVRNPLGLAAGADKMAEALVGWSRMGFGIVECGTVTVRPRTGNPKPRVWRYPADHALVNWMGLPGEGIDAFVENLEQFARQPERGQMLVGASIASPASLPEEFSLLARACAPFVDYLTLNASCPNLRHERGSEAPVPKRTTPEGATEEDATLREEDTDDESGSVIDPTPEERAVLEQIEATKRGAGDRPVLLKLGPTRDKSSLLRIVKAARVVGIDGFVATNTLGFKERALASGLDLTWPTHQGVPVGGYSGPRLLEIAVWMVEQIRRTVGPDIPILGVGGVQSGADAVRLIGAGANAIQVYTGFVFRGPGLIREIFDNLEPQRPPEPDPASVPPQSSQVV